MNALKVKWQTTKFLGLGLSILLAACGGSVSISTDDETQPTNIPENTISQVSFRDYDGAVGQIGGSVRIGLSANALHSAQDDSSLANQVWLYWADETGDTIGQPWQIYSLTELPDLLVPANQQIPPNASMIKAFLANDIGRASLGKAVRFHDFSGNAQLSGPGGNELVPWYYGEDRPKIAINRDNELCQLDNGLVSVVDMANERDEAWHISAGNNLPNTVNDTLFPPFSFSCTADPVNTHGQIIDEIGVWTYSSLNDAMYYGTLVYDSYLKYLGEPPLQEKIRLRVHYGHQWRDYVYWDGAYANFSDAYPYQYSTLSLDSVAHEIGHGVLNRISQLSPYDYALNHDARTLHEAFADISGVVAKYEHTGELDWLHGGENHGLVRQLDKIQTEPEAIASYLDYDDAQSNYYLRIGMITYPFYLLSQKWGIEPAYLVFINAAKICWQHDGTLLAAAECVKQQAQHAGFAEDDVVSAFKTVKIKLFDEGVLSHFEIQQNGLQLSLLDASQTTSELDTWLWDLGDGYTSTDQNPQHIYEQVGEYKVKLTVTDLMGDLDTFSRTIIVSE